MVKISTGSVVLHNLGSIADWLMNKMSSMWSLKWQAATDYSVERLNICLLLDFMHICIFV